MGFASTGPGRLALVDDAPRGLGADQNDCPADMRGGFEHTLAQTANEFGPEIVCANLSAVEWSAMRQERRCCASLPRRAVYFEPEPAE